MIYCISCKVLSFDRKHDIDVPATEILTAVMTKSLLIDCLNLLFDNMFFFRQIW